MTCINLIEFCMHQKKKKKKEINMHNVDSSSCHISNTYVRTICCRRRWHSSLQSMECVCVAAGGDEHCVIILIHCRRDTLACPIN